MKKIFLFIYVLTLVFLLNIMCTNAEPVGAGEATSKINKNFECKYSLANIPNSKITYKEEDGVKTFDAVRHANLNAQRDIVLTVSVNNQKNTVSFKLSNTAPLTNYTSASYPFYFKYLKNTSFNLYNNIASLDGCPNLAILYYKQDSSYYIFNIDVKKTESEYDNLQNMAVIFNGSSIPSNDMYIGSISVYNKTTNSINSQLPDNPADKTQGSFCDQNPNHAFCAKPVSNKDPEEENAYSSFSFCSSKGVLKIFKISHLVLVIFRIFVPIILIITGSITFFKAMMSDDQDNIQKAAKKFIFSLVVGIFVFFIPTLINVAMNLVKHDDSNFSNCKVCLNKSAKQCDSVIKNVKGD